MTDINPYIRCLTQLDYHRSLCASEKGNMYRLNGFIKLLRALLTYFLSLFIEKLYLIPQSTPSTLPI